MHTQMMSLLDQRVPKWAPLDFSKSPGMCYITHRVLFNHSWALLYFDTFTPVLFVEVPELAGIFCESMETKCRVPEYHSFVFYR